MKRPGRRLLVVVFLLLPALLQAQILPSPPLVAAKSWLLLDGGSDQVLAQEDASARIEPAALTQLMTAYVVFSALRQQAFTPEQKAPVSAKAWKAGGARMFLEPSRPVTADELIRGMVIASANDACIALAELVAGTEEAFVARMNREAARLGMKDTHFANATGLPAPNHYSTARDLATLASAIVRDFPDYFPIYSQKQIEYNGVTQENRNHLLWLDPAVDGMKTGHADTAGYALVATARRGARRLISVVMGAESDTMRAHESQKLLNFGFQAFDTVLLYKSGQVVSEFRVWKGASSVVKAGFSRDFAVSLPHGMSNRLKASLESRQPLLAPISRGASVGMLKLTLDGRPWAEHPIQALDTVPVAGFFGRSWDSLRLWLQN